MEDRFALYERGLRCLQEALGLDDPQYDDIMIYKSRLLLGIQEVRLYRSPEGNAEILRVIHQLSMICKKRFQMDFEDWCVQCVEKEVQEVQQSGFPSIGDWKVLQSEQLQHFLRKMLARQGIHLQSRKAPPKEDPIARYKSIPLHAYPLYSSQDPDFLAYIKMHWDAVEGLSNNVYDLHISQAQLCGEENGYDVMEFSYIVKRTGFEAYSLLPGLLFWDKQWNWEFVSFKDKTDGRDMTYVWRLLFEHLRKSPTIATARKVNALLQREVHSSGMNDLALEKKLVQYSSVPLADLLSHNGTAGSAKGSRVDKGAQLIQELKRLPSGDGPAYERLVQRILTFCFEDEFSPFQLRQQVGTSHKKRRRDFIINNKGAILEFWRTLKYRRGVEQILFDAKNYKHPMCYSEITGTLRYLRNEIFGNFMIFLSRQGIKDYEELLEDYRQERRVVLFLKDMDVIDMIEQKRQGEIASTILQDKYDQFCLLT